MVINDWIQTNSVWAVLVVTILVLVYFFIQLIQTIRKRRRNITLLTSILIILGLLFYIYMVFSASEIKRADWAQILLMIGLVTITAVYASSTEKMAKEMREQTVKVSRPLVIQKCVHEKDIWEGSTKDYFSHFEISNVGNGPAIEIEVSLVDNGGNYSSSVRQTFLRTDDSPIKFNPYNMTNLEESTTYYIVCEYQEVFWDGLQKLLYQTRLPFKISKSSEGNKIYIIAGKLEFGKEVSGKDLIDAFRSNSKPQ